MGERTVKKKSGKLPKLPQKLPKVPPGICPKTNLPHHFKYGKCEHCAVPILEPFGPHRNPWQYAGRQVKKKCPMCGDGWLDNYDKLNPCTRCHQPLLRIDHRQKPRPIDALESQSGVCPTGGAHNWKFGKCNKCGINEGYGKYGSNGGNKNKPIKKECPTCAFTWMDKYRKNECPKCLTKLEFIPQRYCGEASTFKSWTPSDAFEKDFPGCIKGGSHTCRFGRCTKCGVGEGELIPIGDGKPTGKARALPYAGIPYW
mmetsp:Transcript_21913/g.48118  ORF Transcript_21913/g.48118 Transcript_21913/m.48118 type:complete len:257 (-) Transcript_21913:129-899(-)|eukprot:CAMPEP_0118934258 /NCGR_PEP_ID=MMETSP1169-20130426/13722_1 /TAXON_ID=36882 /ORGANISM="Pyramimonas obovata, Strain CCMP722" /LENGTH=256 /DNA_ID=CAMNT_0006877139 /DNA_START=243 /DNA_END=1013 /DNA_ORIENTATION=+